jgi:glucosylceramidase
MTGFGASMTDSSAYVLSKLPAATRDKTVADLFSPATGIGISMLRNPMGASDFAVNARRRAPCSAAASTPAR